ncbi:hypothetical protein IPZ58_07435 [Streptomyces roseoverticillatus]|uniref:hypothetical protein n=1 Tax=Streptomyces roseoverticillatus TaxID=66429 RepID=UPI001F179C74|nr:hypothetical protein [Streptomyces roseoverticillatus]MCF3101411.1 hypothetical protein [Streptomyces roseoverticillatus]
MTEPEPVDAQEAPPWSPEQGPWPRVRTWPPAEKPGLYIRVNGRWYHCWVLARHDYADGRMAYQVDIKLPGHDGPVSRMYWWDPRAMRAAKD